MKSCNVTRMRHRETAGEHRSNQHFSWDTSKIFENNFQVYIYIYLYAAIPRRCMLGKVYWQNWITQYHQIWASPNNPKFWWFSRLVFSHAQNSLQWKIELIHCYCGWEFNLRYKKGQFISALSVRAGEILTHAWGGKDQSKAPSSPHTFQFPGLLI